jgi:hypothetical protein
MGVLVLFGLTLWSVGQGFVGRAEQAAALRARLADLAKRPSISLSALRRQDEVLREQLNSTGSGLVSATAELATAHVQARLREVVSEPGRLESIRVIGPTTESGLTVIRATGTLRIAPAQIYEFVSRLEESAPPIFVDAVRVTNRQAIGREPGMAGSAALANVTLTLRAFASPQTAKPVAKDMPPRRG